MGRVGDGATGCEAESCYAHAETTFAIHSLGNGADLRYTQGMPGHEHSKTTGNTHLPKVSIK